MHLRVCITLTTLFAVAPAPAYKGTQKSKKSGDLPSVVLKLPKTRDKNSESWCGKVTMIIDLQTLQKKPHHYRHHPNPGFCLNICRRKVQAP